jgi:hypothetical protein
MTEADLLREQRPVRWPARIVSILFHPLLVGVLMATYMIFWNPDFFIGYTFRLRLLRWITFTNNNLVFPMLVVLLLRGLGFAKSVLMHTQRERVVPYIACITFFFWTWLVFRNQADVPQSLADMCFGIFLATSAGLMLNSFYKVSMHAIGVGGMMGLMVVLLRTGHLQSAIPLAAAIGITGMVCTARLADSDHRGFDIVSGLLVGFLAQLVAAWL